MKAPSEKHLEDWIIANGLVYQIGCTPNDGPDDPDYAESDYLSVIAKLLGRQVRLPSGICDLIGITNFKRPAITVFELKRGPVDSHSLAQCLRYMRDIKTICEEVLHPSEGYTTLHLGAIDAAAEYRALYYMPLVTGALVGSDVADKHIVTACEASDIAVFTYDYIDGDYIFDPLSEWDLDSTKHTTNSRRAG